MIILCYWQLYVATSPYIYPRTVLTMLTLGFICWAYRRRILCRGVWERTHKCGYGARGEGSSVALSGFERVQGPSWWFEDTNPCLGYLYNASVDFENMHTFLVLASHVCLHSSSLFLQICQHLLTHCFTERMSTR
jgi:hypothetical protein